MYYNRAELKREAKTAMSQSDTSPYLIGLLLLLLSAVSSLLSFSLNFPKGTLTELFSGNLENFLAITQDSYQIGFFAGLLSFLLNIMFAVIEFGFMIFCVSVFRRRQNSVGMLFDGFEMFFKVFLLRVITSVFILLWSMLFVVPGIIAAYSYKFAPFLLIDNPHMSVMECIRKSKRLTKGYKSDLFILDLSFILWILLTILFFPVSIYLCPYYMTTVVGFYDKRLAFDRQQNSDFVYTDESQNRGGFEN